MGGDIFSQFDSSYEAGYYTAIPSGEEMTDIIHGGSVVNHHNNSPNGIHKGHMTFQTANAYGGKDTIIDGKIVQSTQSDIAGGEQIYHENALHKITIPNVHGGVDIFCSDMQQEGITFANAYGSEDYLSLHGNSEILLNQQDPLSHSAEYQPKRFTDIR